MQLLVKIALLHEGLGFEVFDCALNPGNIKTWDLTQIGDCQRPQDKYEEAREVNVQVIRNHEIQPQEIWECNIFQTVTATRCGYSSITYNSFELETSAPVKLEPEECRRLVKSKKISMYTKEWDVDSLEHFSFDADIKGK